jgi:hypothetical protein
MAQTKRKRRTKHRGNAAGMVEARGRTGRKPTGAELGGKAGAKRKPVDRRDRVPTWQSAVTRASIAAVLFGVLLIVFFDRPIAAGVSLAALMILVYTPLTYYTDRFAYNRFQRKKAEARASGKKA